MAATADVNTLSRNSGMADFPVADNVKIYKGTLVCVNSSGYAVPGADTSGYVCVGIAEEQVDNTTTGHTAGRYNIRVVSGRRFTLSGTGFTQASVGAPVYVSADNTVAASVSNNILAGIVNKYLSSTSVEVQIAGGGNLGFVYGGTTAASMTGTADPFPIVGKVGATTVAGGAVSVTGGAGGTTGGGGNVSMVGGASGSSSGVPGTAALTGGSGTGGTNLAGGISAVTGGAGGGSAAGGQARLIGGVGGATGAGGAAVITGGVGGATSGTGGAVQITGGAAGATTGIGGTVTITGGAAAGTNIAGGAVNLVGGAATGTGLPGEIQINGSALGFIPVSFNYTASLVTQFIYVASRAVRVKDITGRTRVAGSGGACTIAFFKAPSGTAVGSGTALHSGSFNLVGTADTNQTLSLSATLTDLALAAGDAIGYVLTGTPTSAVGQVTITVVPI